MGEMEVAYGFDMNDVDQLTQFPRQNNLRDGFVVGGVAEYCQQQ